MPKNNPVQVDLTKLKILRRQTAVSFSACKKALEETNNDLEKAKIKLRDWGVEKAAQKADRPTAQGVIAAYVHHNQRVASMVELACETDFVAGNADFRALAQEIAMQAASTPKEIETVGDFLKMEYIREPSKTVSDLLKEAVLKFGENIQLKRFLKWQI